MFLIALAVCVFIRQFLKETMANPAPWPGYREFLGNILPCVPQAATYTQDTSRREGFGFRMLWDGPDGKGDNSPPARERRKMIRAYLATMWVFGIGVRLPFHAQPLACISVELLMAACVWVRRLAATRCRPTI